MWNLGFDLGTPLGSVVVGAIASGTSFSLGLLIAAGAVALTIPLAVVTSGAGRPGPTPGDAEMGQ